MILIIYVLSLGVLSVSGLKGKRRGVSYILLFCSFGLIIVVIIIV